MLSDQAAEPGLVQVHLMLKPLLLLPLNSSGL